MLQIYIFLFKYWSFELLTHQRIITQYTSQEFPQK